MSHSPIHYLIQIGYWVIAVLGFVRAVQEKRSQDKTAYPWVWICLGAISLVLALQETFGVLDMITNALRVQAGSEGLYNDRRPFQAELVGLLPLVIVVLLAGGIVLTRRAWQRYLVALLAMLLMLSLATIQTISFHNTDKMLRLNIGGDTIKHWVGLISIGLSILALIWRKQNGSMFAF